MESFSVLTFKNNMLLVCIGQLNLVNYQKNRLLDNILINQIILYCPCFPHEYEFIVIEILTILKSLQFYYSA